MKTRSNKSVFLEEKTYRHRRKHDAARALPVFGAILLMIPLLWPVGTENPVSNADATLYVFAVWCLLILLAALVSRALRRDPPPE